MSSTVVLAMKGMVSIRSRLPARVSTVGGGRGGKIYHSCALVAGREGGAAVMPGRPGHVTDASSMYCGSACPAVILPSTTHQRIRSGRCQR